MCRDYRLFRVSRHTKNRPDALAAPSDVCGARPGSQLLLQSLGRDTVMRLFGVGPESPTYRESGIYFRGIDKIYRAGGADRRRRLAGRRRHRRQRHRRPLDPRPLRPFWGEIAPPATGAARVLGFASWLRSAPDPESRVFGLGDCGPMLSVGSAAKVSLPYARRSSVR
jgi:hypothetical protein